MSGAWRLGDMECCVCGAFVGAYRWHSRLGVAVCFSCPLTDVKGEDVSAHCMFHVWEPAP